MYEADAKYYHYGNESIPEPYEQQRVVRITVNGRESDICAIVRAPFYDDDYEEELTATLHRYMLTHYGTRMRYQDISFIDITDEILEEYAE